VTVKEDSLENFKVSDIGLLPEDWQIAKLRNYCNLLGGYPFKSEDFIQAGVPVVKIGNLQNGTIVIDERTSFFSPAKITGGVERYILKEGDVLIALTGATTGKIAVVPKHHEGSLLNQRVGKFEVSNRQFHSIFGRYYFSTKSFQERIKGNILQSAQGNVSPKQIENLKIPLPPCSEQHKIASVLSAVQEAKEKTENVISASKELKKSMMKHLFTCGAVPIEEAERVPLKETEIGMIPEHWNSVRINDVITLSQYGLSVRGNPSGKFPILRMNSMQDGRLDLTDLQYVDVDEATFKKFKLNKGDILFNRTNSYELVGKVAVFDVESPFVFASYIVRLMTDSNKIVTHYLNYYLNWQPTQNRLRMLASRGVSQSNINATKLKAFLISLPPLSEQERICETLSAIDEKIQAEETKRNSLEALFKTLLSLLMTGKIRVKDLEI